MLDTVRGLCLISMILYHGMYDLVNVKGYSVPWYNACLLYTSRCV